MGLLLGHYTYKCDLPRPVCYLLQDFLSFSFTFRFPMVESHTFSCRPFGIDQSEVFHKMIHRMGGGRLTSWLFSYWGNETQRDLSTWFCTSLVGGEVMWSLCRYFSHPSQAVFLALRCRSSISFTSSSRSFLSVFFLTKCFYGMRSYLVLTYVSILCPSP